MRLVLILGLAAGLAVAGSADARGQRHSHGGGRGHASHARPDSLMTAPGLDTGFAGGKGHGGDPFAMAGGGGGGGSSFVGQSLRTDGGAGRSRGGASHARRRGF